MSEILKSIKKEYKVKENLGHGAYGFVYGCKHRQTKQEVAVKVIEVQHDSYFLKKLLREIIILRKLSDWDENLYSTKLIDFVLYPGFQDNEEETTTDDSEKISSKHLTHVLLILEKFPGDLR